MVGVDSGVEDADPDSASGQFFLARRLNANVVEVP